MNTIELRTGSCLDENNYPEDPVDLILFDPPFWPWQKQYKQIRDQNQHPLEPIITPSPEDYPMWWDAICKIAQKHLKSSGWFCHKSDSWMGFLSFPITTQYFDYSNEVIWDKMAIGLGRRIRNQHEKVLCYVPKSPKKKYWKYTELPTKKRFQKNLEGNKGEYKIDSWHGSSKGKAFASILRSPGFNNGTLGVDSKGHINQTPFDVWTKFIDFMCPPDGLVLDLTMGLGSIGLAVQELNKMKENSRAYWGIEIKPEYVNKVEKVFFPHTWFTDFFTQKESSSERILPEID